MQRVNVIQNTMVNNNVGVLSLFANSNLILENSVTGGTFGVSGIAVSGTSHRITKNWIDMGQSVVPGNSGVLLLGTEFNAMFGSGYADHTSLLVNTIAGAFLPIWSQTGVSGTHAVGNNILP